MVTKKPSIRKTMIEIHDEADLEECPFCGAEVEKDTMLETPFSGEPICRECFDERGFVICKECQAENDPDDCPNCMLCGGKL